MNGSLRKSRNCKQTRVCDARSVSHPSFDVKSDIRTNPARWAKSRMDEKSLFSSLGTDWTSFLFPMVMMSKPFPRGLRFLMLL